MWPLALMACLGLLLCARILLGPPTDDAVRRGCQERLGPRRVHVVLPATGTSPRFCRSLSTLLIHDWTPVLVNWQGQSHHSAKIFKLLEYLETHTSALFERQLDLPPQCSDERADIVISMDAYDVFAQRSLDVVLDEFARTPARIVYSAEKGCHPPGEPWCEQVPDSPLPHNFYGPNTDDLASLPTCRARFLNSGFVVGYARDLHSLYSDAAAQARLREGQFQADQSIFGPLYTSGRYNMTLDFLGAMATPTFFFEREVGFEPTRPEQQALDTRFLEDEVPWNQFNRVTRQFPALVHYNGLKEWMDDAWKQTWWGGGAGRPVMQRINAFLANATVALDTGHTLAFADLCTGTWQDP